MNKTDLEKYKAVLEAKKAELSAGLRNREDIAIEKTPDALDEVQLAGERELAIRNLDRESNLLRNIRGALARINDGSYGVCLHCEEEIKPKRLDAVPWARYCVTCQERIAARIAEAQIETDEVLGTLASIMRGSLDDFLEYPDWGPPKIDLALAQQRGVLHLLKELATAPDGSIKIKLHDSLRAAVQLSRIMNLDKSQQRTGTLTISQIRAALAKKNKK